VPTLTYPGVYREEIQTQTQVIQDVSTANLALTAFFKKGPVEEPVLVTSLTEAFRIFGDYTEKSLGPTVLANYFANGGQNAYINRVVGAGALSSEAAFAKEILDEDSGVTSSAGVNNPVFTAAETNLTPGTVRVFFNESLDVAAEAHGTTDGSASAIAFSLDNAPIEPGSVVIDFSLSGPAVASVDDSGLTSDADGLGVLTSADGTGTVDYQTGAVSFTPVGATESGDPITADYTHAVAAATLTSESAGAQRDDQRVYHGNLGRHPVYGSIKFEWTDQGATDRVAIVDSSGVISGPTTDTTAATGTVDLETGDFTIDVGANAVEVDGSINVSFFIFAPLTADDDGAGAFTTTGGLATTGTVDYETGDIDVTTVALVDTGVKFYVDYDADIHTSQTKDPGESGDELELQFAANENFLDVTTGLYSKYTVSLLETDAEGNQVLRETFPLLVLDDIADSKHVAQVINDPFLGSAQVEMTSPVSDEIPTALRGGTKSAVLADTGDGTARAIVTVLPLEGGEMAPGSLSITYTSGAATKTITDDGQGSLTGDVDTGVVATIDYETGVLTFTTSLVVDAATTVDVAYTFTPAVLSIGAEYSGGADGAALTRAEVTDFTLSATEQGIYALDKVDEILIIVTPDFAGDWIAEASQLVYAGEREDAMVILSPPEGSSTSQAINYKRNVLASISNRGAMYHPWINIEDPITGNTLAVPPHGHVAGVWARTDRDKNIGKSPAGIRDGSLNNMLGFKDGNLTEADVGRLTEAHINALWQPPRQPRSVWGVRTLEVDGEYIYIVKRRTIDFTSVAVARSMWWAVFENIGPSLFVPVGQQIRSFLRRQFAKGIYAGDTEGEAFFVQVDRSNNPPETIQAGQLIVDYGVATNTPGEFIRLRHRQITA